MVAAEPKTSLIRAVVSIAHRLVTHRHGHRALANLEHHADKDAAKQPPDL